MNFKFNDGYSVIKFDDSPYYRKKFNKLPHSKGVDFIAYNADDFILIEVKDCLSFEIDNKWRTSTGDEDHETFDIEVAHKVASTFSCIVGANTYYDRTSENAEEIALLLDYVKASSIDKTIRVYLVLEGDFEKVVHSRNNKMIKKSIKDRMKTYLSWIHCCKVEVYSIEEINHSAIPFSVERC